MGERPVVVEGSRSATTTERERNGAPGPGGATDVKPVRAFGYSTRERWTGAETTLPLKRKQSSPSQRKNGCRTTMGGTALVGEPSPSLDSGASSGPIPPPPVAIEGPLKLAALPAAAAAAAIADGSSFACCCCWWCNLSVDDDPRLFLG